MRFCPKCGKKGIKGDFCSSCSEQGKSEQLEIKLLVCKKCKRYYRKTKWIPYKDIHAIIKRAVKDNLKHKVGITFNIPAISDAMLVHAECNNKHYELPVLLDWRVCEHCSKQAGGYYEGILQLRNVAKEVFSWVEKEVERQDRRNIFISKVLKQKNGCDMYISSQKYLQVLGNKLQKTFGGILKITSSLHTQDKQTSKNLYRVNVLFEGLIFGKGDVIPVKNKLLHITNMQKQVIGIDLITGKKTSFHYKDILEVQPLSVRKTKVCKVYPIVEVLHPETYEPIKVGNSKPVKNGENVVGVVHQGKMWLL
jgi:nonsense-mediated mRNA decay protein 3